jgi:hypothetical protein
VRWLGYRTFRGNRADAATEQIGVAPDCVGRDLDDLASFVIGDARVRSGRGQPLTAPAVSPAAYWSTKNE